MFARKQQTRERGNRWNWQTRCLPHDSRGGSPVRWRQCAFRTTALRRGRTRREHNQHDTRTDDDRRVADASHWLPRQPPSAPADRAVVGRPTNVCGTLVRWRLSLARVVKQGRGPVVIAPSLVLMIIVAFDGNITVYNYVNVLVTTGLRNSTTGGSAGTYWNVYEYGRCQWRMAGGRYIIRKTTRWDGSLVQMRLSLIFFHVYFVCQFRNFFRTRLFIFKTLRFWFFHTTTTRANLSKGGGYCYQNNDLKLLLCRKGEKYEH